MKKLLLCLCVALVLVTGCGKVPTLENGQEAVVTLEDGKDGVSVDDLYTKMKNNYALNTLLDMVDEKILTAKYESDSAEEAYIQSQLDQLQIYYDYYYNQEYATFEQFIINYYGVSSVDVVEEMIGLSYKRNLETESYSKTLVSEKEIKKYYNDEIFGEITASHILIRAEYEDGATEDEIAAAEEKALQTAKDIIAKLKNGEDFAELAKKYSSDGSASNGGALDPFSHGDMVEEFEDAAVKLKVGSYSTTPVKTTFGYHIILKTAQADKPALDDVREEIITAIAEDKRAEDENITAKALIKMREDNGVEIQDDELKKQYKKYVSQYE